MQHKSRGLIGGLLLCLVCGIYFLARQWDGTRAENQVMVGEITLHQHRSAMPAPLHQAGLALPTDFKAKLSSLCWVAFSPTNWNPEKKIKPSEESIRADLLTLRRVGFDGLVTYGAMETVARLANETGFKGMLFGIWNPSDKSELAQAKAAASSGLAIGFVVGNEGLDVRYSYDILKNAIAELKQATGKPVTTTEEIGDYADSKVAALGDWLFPNTHPYYQRLSDPQLAVQWTQQKFRDLVAKTSKPVMFKEVGFPSSGDRAMSEQTQASYYTLLSKTDVKFVWFEAYDQPWKKHTPVEPYWGLFRKDRSPKEVVSCVCKNRR